jgi:hypothetical protein
MGILDILSPAGMIGSVIKTALTGPLIGGMVDGYKAKVAAGNTTEKIYADLAGRELQVEQRERELAVTQNISDNGRWWTSAPRAIVMWSLAIYVAKCVVWDTVLGLGTTPEIKGAIAAWFGTIMVMWFGGRTLEKITAIIKRK